MTRKLMLILILPVLIACGSPLSGAGTSSNDPVLAAAVEGFAGGQSEAEREPSFEGVTGAEAHEMARAQGLSVRVLYRAGRSVNYNLDLRMDRLNLFLGDDGKVKWAGRG